MRYLFLAIAIGTEIAATLSLRAALDAPAFYIVVVAGYVASFVLMAAVLRAGMPIGVAYGIWGAVGVAATALLSFALFGEPITGWMILGIVLIAAGVLVVEAGSGLAARASARQSAEAAEAERS